mmetsp:Transcript_9526/g.30195  ORF Transcript_9526/g.30195 Transcript_9526/m.30195 type:complete len:252 (+) Transcript_9526:959-1714(+)
MGTRKLRDRLEVLLTKTTRAAAVPVRGGVLLAVQSDWPVAAATLCCILRFRHKPVLVSPQLTIDDATVDAQEGVEFGVHQGHLPRSSDGIAELLHPANDTLHDCAVLLKLSAERHLWVLLLELRETLGCTLLSVWILRLRHVDLPCVSAEDLRASREAVIPCVHRQVGVPLVTTDAKVNTIIKALVSHEGQVEGIELAVKVAVVVGPLADKGVRAQHQRRSSRRSMGICTNSLHCCGSNAFDRSKRIPKDQ